MEKPNTPSHLHPCSSADVPRGECHQKHLLYLFTPFPLGLSPPPLSLTQQNTRTPQSHHGGRTDGSVLAQWQK